MHAYGHHHQVGLARVVQKPTHITHCSRIHKRPCELLPAPVLLDSDDVVHVLGGLRQLPPLRFLEPENLPGVLAHEAASRNSLQSQTPPAAVLRTKHTQTHSHPVLDQPGLAGLAAFTQNVTLKHRLAVERAVVFSSSPLLCQAALAGVGLAKAQTRAAVRHTGAGAAGAARECHFIWVNVTAWTLNIHWSVLQNTQSIRALKMNIQDSSYITDRRQPVVKR